MTTDNADSETARDVSSDSEESWQTTAEMKLSNSEIAEQTEDKAADTQDSVQTDEQEVTVEESADDVTVT